MKIKVLEKNIADKIAAGEVIERPISIVKELIENSIDAGAKSITCEIANGGKSFIRVTDDGVGIEKDDIETAFLRHATSKISSINDLNGIVTLGFRGEALASICAVSRTELITKTYDQDLGARLVIHGGETVTLEEMGCPNGTTIIVSDLFYNTPARLKFMKQDATETQLIIQFLSEMALCYKDIRFRLISNGKNIFTTKGDGDRLDTIVRVFKDVDKDNLVKLDFNSDGISIDGYISKPIMSRTTRSNQIFFVNGRVVNSKVIDKGIDLGYKERLFEGRFPVVYLFINVDPTKLDVNIHPNKREVRFDQDNIIIDSISKAIVNALSTKESISSLTNVIKNNEMTFNESPRSTYAKSNPFKIRDLEENTEEMSQVDIKELLSTYDNSLDDENLNSNKIDFEEIFLNEAIEIEKPLHKAFDFDELKYIGTLFDTYILLSDDNSFYMIDQHAAQERINYEKFVNEYNSIEKHRQELLLPLIINVSLASSEGKHDYISKLTQMGFNISEFGVGTYRVTEIPMFMEIGEAESFLREFIDEINTSTDLRNKVVIDKLIMMSCKASIKANDKLSKEEVLALINELKCAVNPYSCPHGRPTIIKLTQYEIERMFKRV